MKLGLLSILVALAFHTAHAQTVETEMFYCDSTVAGFEHFTLTQAVTTAPEGVKTKYFLKTGLIGEEVWDQHGNPIISEENPVFQSMFSRIVTITPQPDPETEPAPVPTEPPVSYKEELFMYISVNTTGTGSISVNADLAPIDCRKPPAVLP